MRYLSRISRLKRSRRLLATVPPKPAIANGSGCDWQGGFGPRRFFRIRGERPLTPTLSPLARGEGEESPRKNVSSSSRPDALVAGGSEFDGAVGHGDAEGGADGAFDEFQFAA